MKTVREKIKREKRNRSKCVLSSLKKKMVVAHAAHVQPHWFVSFSGGNVQNNTVRRAYIVS